MKPIGPAAAVLMQAKGDEPTPIISIKSIIPPELQLDSPGKQPAVFMDRDGVINTTQGFVNSPEDLDRQLIPRSIEAIAKMSRATSVKLVIVTNQGGVSGGSMTDEQARAILARLAERVKEAGGRLDAIYYAPNGATEVTPKGEISARKPEGGMLLEGARKLGVDLADSFMVGDMVTDFGAGKSASQRVTTIGVRTGFSSVDLRNPNAIKPDVLFDDLDQFADWFATKYGPQLPTESPAQLLESARAFKEAPANLEALVNRAQTRLFLRLDRLDAGLTDRLLMAQQRGVDVRVVLAPGKRLDEYEVQRVLALTDSGVDLKVTNTSKLPVRAGVSDDTPFQAFAQDPVVPERPPSLDGDAASFTAELERELKDPVSGGGPLLPPGQVKVHRFPEENAGVIIGAIENAKTSIDLEVYQLTDRGIIEALERAAKRGVKVRVMVEPRALEPSNFPFLSKRLQAAGIEVRATPKAFDSDRNVDHAKFFVIDKHELFFGTGNLVRLGLGGNEHREANTRDFWVEDTREAPVREAGGLFEADWNQTPTRAADFPTLTVTPDDSVSDLGKVIDASTKRLFFANQSLADDDMVAKLIAAKQRGVDVKVLLGAFQRDERTAPSNEAAAAKLRAAGIEVKYFTAAYLHAKVVVSDDRAFVGSQNFTSGGLVRNRELGCVYDDPALVWTVAKTFQDDWVAPD